MKTFDSHDETSNLARKSLERRDQLEHIGMLGRGTGLVQKLEVFHGLVGLGERPIKVMDELVPVLALVVSFDDARRNALGGATDL